MNDYINKSPVEYEEIRIIDTTQKISTIFSSIGRKIVVPQKIVLVKGNLFIFGNLLDNLIHLIIKNNLLLIHRIINHNLLNTTNVNSIFSIKEQKILFQE